MSCVSRVMKTKNDILRHTLMRRGREREREREGEREREREGGRERERAESVRLRE